MRKSLRFILGGIGVVTIVGGAMAASRDLHVMTVPLPDGSTARVEYVGNVAPKVTVTPGAIPSQFAPFVLFDRGGFNIDRQIDEMMRQVEGIARAPIGTVPGMNVAAFGNAPVQSSSVTVVSTSSGAKTCTRTTEVTAQGPGKAPRVISKVTGDCADHMQASPEKPTT